MLKEIKIPLNDTHHRRLVIAVSLFLLLLLMIIISRIYAAIMLRNMTKEAAVTTVSVMIAKEECGTEQLLLPGNVLAWHEAPVYARTNGYIKKWYVDIGSRVKMGDLLAEIETPELDAQARQAAADLNTAIANNNLAQTTAKRWLNLVKTDFVSKQAADEKVSAAQALEAAMISARENLDRISELVRFKQIVAPFDGMITARATDIGDLINAGSSTTAKPLFRIAQTAPLRIYVKIPQNYSSRLQADMSVSLHFAEYPQHEFSAKLLDTAHAIDPGSRTLLAQFSTENKDGLLLPGAYTEVRFSFPIPEQSIRLPVNTLLFQAAGLQVAVVDKNNKIILKSVTIKRDFGSRVEIATGISPGEQIVLNPPDAISNGETVHIVP